MIIRKLIINNFRNYFGTNTFDLTTTKDQNIVLIGGQNGAGKTTLADSIRLCLYGHWVDGRILSEAKYQDYLSNICSAKRGVNSFFVSIELTMDEENPPIDVTVTRKFTKKGQKFQEELVLKKGDSEVELIDEDYWSYYIEKLISPTVSRYFFFDGEKVRDTIASSQSKEYLVKAVNDISGVTELNNLKTDLIEVRKRVLAKNSQESSLRVINNLSEQISGLSSKKEKLLAEIENQNEFLKSYEESKEEVNQERSRLIGSSESKRVEIADRIDELKRNHDEINQIIIDFCYSKLMYRLADSAIRRTVSEAKAENKSVIGKYSAEYLDELRSKPLDLPGIDDITVDAVLDKIIDRIHSEGSESSGSLLDLTLSRIDQIDSMRVSVEECIPFVEQFMDREYYSQEIVKYTKSLSKIEDESLKGIDDGLIELSTQIEVARIEIARKESEVQSLSTEIDNLHSQLKREERTMILVDVNRTFIETVEEVLENIDKRIELSLLKSRQILSKRINEMYLLLKNNRDMVKELVITDSFELELINFDDKPINKEFISEGEKGILMYSVVYGLHALSTMKFPVIIDSPLGRMDTLHVNNLASKLFPTVADQVILLSHDREVVGENHDLIRKYVAKQYLITKFGDPKVKEGYFE